MFDIQGEKIKINLDDLAVPPFREYYNNAEDKSQALKEIEYIVWLHKWNTPYLAYSENERAQKVSKDVFGEQDYKPSPALLALAERFKEFQETPGTRLLSASQSSAESITDTLTTYSKTTLDIDTAIKVTKILKDVGNIIKSLDTAMKQAKAEQVESGRVKGGGVIGLYEMTK